MEKLLLLLKYALQVLAVTAFVIQISFAAQEYLEAEKVRAITHKNFKVHMIAIINVTQYLGLTENPPFW